MVKVKLHECDALNKDDVPMTIENHDGNWIWCFWGNGHGEGHGIRFCPYCGKFLYEQN